MRPQELQEWDTFPGVYFQQQVIAVCMAATSAQCTQGSRESAEQPRIHHCATSRGSQGGAAGFKSEIQSVEIGHEWGIIHHSFWTTRRSMRRWGAVVPKKRRPLPDHEDIVYLLGIEVRQKNRALSSLRWIVSLGHLVDLAKMHDSISFFRWEDAVKLQISHGIQTQGHFDTRWVEVLRYAFKPGRQRGKTFQSAGLLPCGTTGLLLVAFMERKGESGDRENKRTRI